MAILFELSDGRTGTLDVAKLIAEEEGGEITGVKNGLVHFTRPQEGTKGAFSLAQWAEDNQAKIIKMDGFNSADSALEAPPVGMNYMDQSVFYQDGMDRDALSEMFPKNMYREDGRVVVLDQDGLWKTMWSPYLHAPLPAPDYDELAETNQAIDKNLMLRTAGIHFLFGLAGQEVQNDREGNISVDQLVKVLKIIGRNAPHEVRTQIGILMEQTTGLSSFKFINAILAPEEVGAMLLTAKKGMSSFDYRMKQLEMAETLMRAQHMEAREAFMDTMTPLIKLPETNGLVINLAETAREFINLMVGMDLLRDISKTTGLNEWIALNEDEAYDPSRLPDMPEFVPKFVMMLKWLMPIVKEERLAMATGRAGFKAIVNLMVMIDDCIFAMSGVPDHSAKYKMIMALKKLQAGLETKLCFTFHPDPLKNKTGLRENPFMQAKQQYSPLREAVYKAIQNPKESWNKVLLGDLVINENVERFYDGLNPKLVNLWKAFAAMDAAYDMQPWVDVDYASRTNDAFSDFHPMFGQRPPEAGYLQKNSPRAVKNISESLIVGSTILSGMDEKQSRELLRNPFHFMLLIKSMMVASVNREIGTVEVLNKFGLGPNMDKDALPDPHRMWEDPELVQQDIDRQVEELMGSLAMESMAQNPQRPQKDPTQSLPPMEEEVPQAGPGPNGPPSRAMPMRR